MKKKGKSVCILDFCIDQSEGFPRTGYFFPACVERWAGAVCQSCWDAVAAAAVAVISPGAIFFGEKYVENRVVEKKIKE